MKYAIDFDLEVLENGKYEWNSPVIACERGYVYEEYDFEYDVWDWLKDEQAIKDLKLGTFHVFLYGNVRAEWSENWEYGKEYDGLVFEADNILVEGIDA